MLTRNKKIALALVAVVSISAAAASFAWYRRGAAAHTESIEAVYVCPMHPQIVREKPGECPVCGMKLEKREKGAASVAPPATSPARERRILYYRHPMDPSVRSETPAKDDMGMDYVPVYEDELQGASTVAGRASVTVPPERAQLLSIRSEPVAAGFRGGTLRTVGRVAMDERRREVVHARYAGYVEKLFVDFTGRQVRQGQALLAIYSPELIAAQKEYLVARRAQARLGESSVPGVARGGTELAEASRQRLRYFDMSPAEIAELERTGEARRTLTLRAPASGVVVQKMAFEGMKVSPEDRLFEIADLSRAWILADVFEKDLGAVRLGLGARVTLPNQPATELRGKVTFVAPTAKPETRTVEVRVEVDNDAGVLRPDMFADVYLEGSAAAVRTVPESAVIQTGERTLVFVDKGEGRYEPREITIGTRVPGGYEVVSGVAPGERVVVSANFLLDSESSLRAAIARTGRGN